jgi:hypothetical protein
MLVPPGGEVIVLPGNYTGKGNTGVLLKSNVSLTYVTSWKSPHSTYLKLTFYFCNIASGQDAAIYCDEGLNMSNLTGANSFVMSNVCSIDISGFVTDSCQISISSMKIIL